MISDAVVLEVVGTDLLRSTPAADLGATLLRESRGVLLLLEVIKARPQHFQGSRAVLDLALLVLHRHHQPCRQVGYAHGRVRRVDRLPTWTGGAIDVDTQVAGLYLDLDLVGFGQHVDRRRGGVHATLRLGDRDPLHPVRARLEMQALPGVLTLYEEGHAVDAPKLGLAKIQHLDSPAAVIGGITLVHVEKVLGEQVRLLASLGATDLDDDVATVIGVPRHQKVTQLGLELHDPCLSGTLLVSTELAFCPNRGGGQLTGHGGVVLGSP